MDYDMKVGTSDPYCIITINPEPKNRIYKKKKTKVIDRDLNPIWNEEFTLNLTSYKVNPDHYASSRVVVDVYDKDTLTSDDFIGRTSWTIEEIKNYKIDGIYKLLNKEHGLRMNHLIQHSDEQHKTIMSQVQGQTKNETGLDIDQFDLISVIGRGNYGTVLYAKYNQKDIVLKSRFNSETYHCSSNSTVVPLPGQEGAR